MPRNRDNERMYCIANSSRVTKLCSDLSWIGNCIAPEQRIRRDEELSRYKYWALSRGVF